MSDQAQPEIIGIDLAAGPSQTAIGLGRATVGAVLMGQPMAISPEHGGPFLATAWPQAAGGVSAVKVERGERFAVARGLAVVPVRGLLTANMTILERYLGWTTYHGLVETMDELAASEDVRGIALEFDTPGGLVLGTEGAVQAIVRAAAVKPVHALVNPLAASAGYWLASQASEIAMTAGSSVGSVGTMWGGSAPVQPGMDGLQWYVMRSAHAQAKNADPSTEAGTGYIQQRLDDAEARFHASVAAGRKIPPAELPARLALSDDPQSGGSIFEADEAISRGLADAIETRAAFYSRLMGLYAPPPARPRARARAMSAAAGVALARART